MRRWRGIIISKLNNIHPFWHRQSSSDTLCCCRCAARLARGPFLVERHNLPHGASVGCSGSRHPSRLFASPCKSTRSGSCVFLPTAKPLPLPGPLMNNLGSERSCSCKVSPPCVTFATRRSLTLVSKPQRWSSCRNTLLPDHTSAPGPSFRKVCRQQALTDSHRSQTFPCRHQSRLCRAHHLSCAALPPFAAVSNLWQSWQPWSAWAAALAVAAAVFLALKRIFDTPSRAYDANVGDVYDDWTDEGVLEYFWGEHIHLGYYNSQEQQKAWRQPIWTGTHPKGFKQAKFDFIDEMLAWSEADQPATILDVGCGIGGTTRHLAAKFPDAKVTGAWTPPSTL